MLLTLLPALTLLLPASAQALGWVTGLPLSPAGQVARHPMIALTSSGERIVAWEQLQAGTENVEGLAVRVAPAGGNFGPIQQLMDPNASNESLTVGSDGTAALVWVGGTPGFNVIRIARLDPGHTSFAQATSWAANAPIIRRPSVAIGAGDIYVAFDTEQNLNPVVVTTVQIARLAEGATDPTAGTIGGKLDQETFNSNPIFNQPPRRVLEPSLAVQGDTVHALWERTVDGTMSSFTEVRHATRVLTDATFTSLPSLATFSPATAAAPEVHPLVAAGGGKVYAVWTPAGTGALQARDVTGGPVLSIPTAGSPNDVHAALDATGSVLLGWDAFPTAGAASAVFATAVPAAGLSGPPPQLTPPTSSRVLDDFTVGGDGSALAVTDLYSAGGSGAAAEQIQASLRPPGGAFGSLEDVSGIQVHPDAGKSDAAAAAIGPGGQALIAWSADDRSGAANQRIFVSERDANPPVIGSLTVPDATTAGKAVPMSVQASDSISAVTIGWDFGDGSTGAGSSLTHTFATPGSYTVTVTARDAAGNVSTATRRIDVTPAPSTPGPSTPTDQTPPVISALKVTNAQFRISRVSTAALAAKRKAPIGTAFTLNLSERSTLRLAIVGKLRGRKAGKRCVVGRKHGPRCSTLVSLGPIVRSGRGPGRVSIPFSGRTGSKTLPPGSYLATFTAVDDAGNSSTPKTVRFAVVAK